MNKADEARKADLLRAFGGNVEGWEYVGMTDAGEGVTRMMNPPKCPCGHVIRYICNWEHKDGRKTHTGNVCVDSVPELGAEIFSSIAEDTKRLKKEEADAKKAAKLEAKMAEVHAMRDKAFELTDKEYRLSEKAVQGLVGWLDGELYWRVEGWKRTRGKIRAAMKMKSASGMKNRLESIMKWMGK